MEKKKGFSLLKFLIVLICLVLIAFSVAVNVLFKGGATPKILDNYIYIGKESDNISTWLDTARSASSKMYLQYRDRRRRYLNIHYI